MNHTFEGDDSLLQRLLITSHKTWLARAFTTTGGMGDAASQVYRRLANLLTEKLELSYGEVMGWIKCKLSFALVRSAIMCIRGARSRMHSPIFDAPMDVQIVKLAFSQVTVASESLLPSPFVFLII